MSIVQSLRYTAGLLTAAAAALPLDKVGADLTQARAELAATREAHGKLLADAHIARGRIGKAGNEKSRAYFETQATQAEAFVAKSEVRLKLQTSGVQRLANGAAAVAVRYAKLTSDAADMVTEADRLSDGGLV